VKKSTGHKKNGAMARTDMLPAPNAAAIRRQPDSLDIDPARKTTPSAERRVIDARVVHVLREDATAGLTLFQS
jgi:hypothetical protein